MKNKLKKYDTLHVLHNVVEAPAPRGRNFPEYRECIMPEGSGPLTLELGCGRGEYTLALARMFPEKRFIGVDIKGARLWHGATRAAEEGLSNVLFLRTRIEMLGSLLPEGSASEIWIPFPEPFVRNQSKYVARRLTSQRFLDVYRGILEPGGIINLKTDSDTLFDFTFRLARESGYDIIHATDDLHSDKPDIPGVMISSIFEQRYIREGIPIKYLRFSLSSDRKHG